MVRPDARDLLERIDAAGSMEGGWDDVLSGFTDLFPGAFVMMFRSSTKGGGNDSFLSKGINSDMMIAFDAHYGAINPWNSQWLASAFGRPIRTLNVRPANTLRGSEFYEDFLLKLDERHDGIGIKLACEDGSMLNLACHLPNRGLDRTEPDLARIIEQVSGALVQAGEMNVLLAREVDRARSGAAIINRIDDAAFVVDETMRLHDANALGEQCIRLNDTVFLRTGRLAFREGLATNWLSRVMSELSRRDQKTGTNRIFRVKTGMVRLSVWLLPRSRRHSLLTRPLYLLRMRDLAVRSPANLSDILASAFGLTVLETSLCIALSDNKTIREAADALAITDQTARTYLKRIFAKTGTSRQAELVALLIRMG